MWVDIILTLGSFQIQNRSRYASFLHNSKLSFKHVSEKINIKMTP